MKILKGKNKLRMFFHRQIARGWMDSAWPNKRQKFKSTKGVWIYIYFQIYGNFFPSPFVTRNSFCRHRNLDQVIFRVYFPFKEWSYNCIDSIPSNDELWQVFYRITFAEELWEDEEKGMKQYSNCSRYQRIFNISFKNYKWLITRWDCIENV